MEPAAADPALDEQPLALRVAHQPAHECAPLMRRELMSDGVPRGTPALDRREYRAHEVVVPGIALGDEVFYRVRVGG